jgi:hypothetical protein
MGRGGFSPAEGLGSTVKTVDSSGVVVNEYEYDVDGTPRSSFGSQVLL